MALEPIGTSVSAPTTLESAEASEPTCLPLIATIPAPFLNSPAPARISQSLMSPGQMLPSSWHSYLVLFSPKHTVMSP